ncbi:HlyD family efflux transporter periplasmic adaptor subunit [Candidatus Poribacteria bacterium]|nr:HlyD family efflux transporter periplasmic adaptor subunit [Candidatus Poribacteria bacterium]
MNRKRTIVLIISVLVLVAVVAIGATKIFGKKDNKDNGDEKKEVVRRGEFIVKVRESGNLEPLISVEVRSNVEGEIEMLYIKEGDVVEKEQALLKIDHEQVLEQKKQAEANRDARRAQLEQATLRIGMTEKQQESAITQAQNAVAGAKAALESLDANTRQRITEAETQISTTQNALQQDEISLRQSEIGREQAALALERARAAEESAKVTFETAESELKRNQGLFEKKLVSNRVLEETETARANALSQYETAQKDVESQRKAVESEQETIDARKKALESRQATLELHKKNLGTIKESEEAQRKQRAAELENAKTQLQQILETTDEEKQLTVHEEVGAKAAFLEAESTLKAQEERFGWTTVVAPMSGTVTRLNVEEGEIVTSGRSAFSQGPAVLTIADLSRMVVKTRINEVDIAKIDLGQRVEIRVDAYRDKVFEGRVSEIAPSAYTPDPRGGQQGDGTITFEVVIEVVGSPAELLPGMSADVDIIVMQDNNVLQLPIDSVIDSEVLTVKVNVPSNSIERFKSDQEVEVQNLIGKKFSGKVGKISPSSTRGNVEILLDGSPRGLRSGPTEVHVLFSETDKIEGLEAEIESEKKYFVLLDKEASKTDTESKKDKKKDEKGIRTRIEVGQRNNTHFELTSGLVEGDRVFVPSMEELTKTGPSNK